MLIDNTYFNEKTNIPNINSNTALGQGLRDKLDKYIKIFEPKYFELLFGADFYTSFSAGIENSEQRMIDLKNLLIDETLNISVIANYVYFYYAKANQNDVFGTKGESGYTLKDPNTLYDIWNEMAEKSFEVYEYLIDNSTVYPEFNQPFYLSYINSFGI